MMTQPKTDLPVSSRLSMRWMSLVVLLLLSVVRLPAQTEPPEKERELGLTPSAQGGGAVWLDSLSIGALRFFEKGREEIPPDQRLFQTEFDQATTRYVAWDLQLRHPPAPLDQSLNLEAVFYGPDDREIGRLENLIQCVAGARDSHFSRGWGWPDPGFWTEGQYRVAFRIGEKQLGEKRFSIVRSSPELSREEWLRSLQFDFLRFYEKGKETVPYEERAYRSWFPQASTRYVAWEIHLKHPAPERSQEINLQAIYYFPDGRVFGRDEIKTWTQAGWPSSWHTGGWGWPKAGYWQPGIYRVEFFAEGQRLATDYFEIK